MIVTRILNKINYLKIIYSNVKKRGEKALVADAVF